MNKVILIGNLTRDPELRTTPSGDSVCSFTIAVNRRRRSNAEAGQPEADFFRVSAWRQLGENCAKYLAKGRKVFVSGPVTCRTYVGNDGQTRASLGRLQRPRACSRSAPPGSRELRFRASGRRFRAGGRRRIAFLRTFNGNHE